MTAHSLQLLFTFYVFGKDTFFDEQEDHQSIQMLRNQKLLSPNTYEITTLGIAHIQQLIRIPLPIVKQTTVYLSTLDNQPILPIQ